MFTNRVLSIQSRQRYSDGRPHVQPFGQAFWTDAIYRLTRRDLTCASRLHCAAIPRRLACHHQHTFRRQMLQGPQSVTAR